MTTHDDPAYRSLIDIVGQDYASNRPEEQFIYSVDSGTEGPRKVDYVVMPKTVEEVQKVVVLANQYRVPITPMGANLTLNGLGIPVNGGIVLDMKRMDRILELNRQRKYVVVEAGVTQGKLGSYLEKNCPELEHSRPEAPPMATIVGNIVIRGHGCLSLRYGNNAHHINGMEVVLPTGEICEIGAGCVSPWPFCKGPLPDLTGLFCGWNGTTGIITKLSLKLFPKRRMLDVVGYRVNDLELVPEVLNQIADTDMVDNLFVVGFASASHESHKYVTASITGDLDEEIAYKRAVLKKIAAGYERGKGELRLSRAGPAQEPVCREAAICHPGAGSRFRERGRLQVLRRHPSRGQDPGSLEEGDGDCPPARDGLLRRHPGPGLLPQRHVWFRLSLQPGRRAERSNGSGTP